MATPISYTSLEPSFTENVIPSLGKTISATGGEATFFASVSFLTTFAYVVAIVAAGVMFVKGGTRRMDGSPEGIRRSNEIMKRASIGLLGVLSLVLFMLTLNPDLVTGRVGLERLKVEVGTWELGTRAGSPSVSGQTTRAGTSSSTPSVSNPSYEARLKSHKEIASQLGQYGITTNHNGYPCSEAQFAQASPRCTSLSYLASESVQMLINLKQACKCDVMVTGATEPGHAKGGSHREGGRGIDLRIGNSQSSNDPLLLFLRNEGVAGGGTAYCYSTYQWGGFRFCDEKPLGNSTWAPHLHVD